MYGWYELKDGEWTLRYPDWKRQLQPLSDDEKQVRVRASALRIVSAFPANAQVPLTQKIVPRAAQAWSYLASTSEAKFAICMCVAFFRLHGDNADAVLAQIDQEIVNQFGRVPDKGGCTYMARTVNAVQGFGYLLPVASRKRIFEEMCYSARRDAFKQSDMLLAPGLPVTELWKAYLGFRKSIAEYKKDLRALVEQVLLEALYSCPDDQSKATIGDIGKLIKNHQLGGLCPMFVAQADQMTKTVSWGYRLGAARQLLKIAAANVDARPGAKLTVAQMVDHVINQACSAARDEDAQRAGATDDAIAAGVDFGDATRNCRIALAALRARRLNEAVSNASAVAVLPSPSDNDPQADMRIRQQLQDWSVWQVTRWIEGSLTRRQPSRPIDLAKAAQHKAPSKEEKKPASPEEAGAATQDAPQDDVDLPEVDIEPPSAEFDDATVEQVGVSGYRATADYFANELADAAALGDAVHADPKLVEDCKSVASKVAGLLHAIDHAPGSLNEAEAQDLFGTAEQLLADLGRSIQGAKADANLKGKFDFALRSALAAEPLELFRRQGGKIGCPLGVDDWPWVYEKYHARMLKQRHLKNGNRNEPLQSDEALALYVTYDSRTPRHVFNLTIHLWRRVKGSNEPPGLPVASVDELPSMNQEHWFDTYVPCGVLHVPRATK